MKNRSLQVALRIALLKEEFTEGEILEAVKLLESQGSSSPLFLYLEKPSKTSKKSRRKTKPIAKQRSKAVTDLKRKDPEKFRLLSRFDSLLRSKSALPDSEDIRRLGKQLGEGFTPKNPRAEAIGKLMALLADHPLEKIKEIVQASSASEHSGDQDSEYQQLARFIITGKTSETKRE